jgi:formamidopyrimidine-DNA glycosylase
MPELPEVEVVRRGLDRWVKKRTIDLVEVLHPRAIRRHLPGAIDFVDRLRGQEIVSVDRRGKYLWLTLSDDQALIAHLGMSGQLLVLPPESPVEKHARTLISFTDGGYQLRFIDQRTFGGFALDEMERNARPRTLAHIAPDPFDPLFDPDAVVTRMRGQQREVKRALLDQRLISGIGNIYADEALWRAKVHPRHLTHRLTRVRALSLVSAATEVMAAALAEGGTSFDSLYVNVNGESGYFERSLQAYGRRGQPCFRCSTPIIREAFMNRSSHYCPTCQSR